jgi:hypothetical protein
VAWAIARVGAPDYALRCLAFVEDAFERANGIEVFGGSSAAESAELYGLQAYDGGAPPPEGSYVFYACAGPADGAWRNWGHVGLALGDGRVVHAWDSVRIDPADAVEHLTPPASWSAPRLIGWVAPDRILDGHRPRSWTDA